MALVTSAAASLKNTWGFSPQSIPGLALWLDGADTTSITGTSTVTAWRDKSGNGNNATATGSPALTPNAINGVQAISTAVGTYFRGSVPISGSTLTCFAVATTNVTLPNLRNPRRDQRLVSLANGTNPDYASNGLIALFNQDNTSTIAAFDYPNFLGRPSNPIVKDIPFLAVTHFNGTTASLWFNGSAGTVPTSAYSTSFSITKYGIGEQAGVVSPNNENWSGFFGEIILFNTALTTSERQQVEGYLAAKWGLGMNLPTTHPYSSVIPILPTQIPGLQLWLDAADASTIVGSPVTQWNDKSGNGRNATATGSTITVSTLNGVPAINYDGSSYLTAPVTAGVADPFTVFVVFNAAYPISGPIYTTSTQSNGTGLYVALARTSDGDTARNDFLGRGDPTNNYLVQGSSTFLGNRTYVVSVVSTSVNGGSITLFRDGTSYISTTTLGAFQWTTFLIGKRNITGNTDQMAGKFGEFIIFNTALSTTQRQQMEQYLGQKWGIGVTNTTVAPGRYLIPFNRPFYPTDIPGCALWLDGADRTSITFSPGTNNVTAWADKSGTGNNMSQISAGVSYASDTMTFASGGVLRSSSYTTITQTQSVIYVVCQVTAMTDGWATVFACSDINNGDSSLRFSPNTTTIADGFVGTTIYLNGTTTILAPGGTMSAPGGYNIIGATPNGQSGSTRFSLSTLFMTRYFTGNIREVIVYTGPITTPQRQQVEGYLAWKWGLVANLPPATSHLGKLLPAFSTNFTPKLISGCQLWLDGADRNSMTFSSGSNVSSWNDKSGNARNMSTTANFPVYTDTGVRFTGSTPTVLSNAAGYSATTALNCFVVYQSTLATTRQRIFRCSRTGNFNDATIDTTFIGSFGTTSTSKYQGPLTYSTNTPSIISLVAYSAPSIAWAIDGSGSSVWSFSGPATASDVITFTVGGGQTDVYFTGFIMEVLMFDTFFTRSQQQQVEGHLAWKWGLQSSLPSTHAYAKFSP
jgi:hypothetical protein